MERVGCARGLTTKEPLSAFLSFTLLLGLQELKGIALLPPQLVCSPAHTGLPPATSSAKVLPPGVVVNVLQVLEREAGATQDLSLHVPDKGLHELKQRLLPLRTQLGGRFSLGRGKNPTGR